VPLAGPPLARPAEPALDLVEDERHLVLVGDLAEAFQEAVRRHDDAALALNGFDEDTDRIRQSPERVLEDRTRRARPWRP